MDLALAVWLKRRALYSSLQYSTLFYSRYLPSLCACECESVCWLNSWDAFTDCIVWNGEEKIYCAFNDGINYYNSIMPVGCMNFFHINPSPTIECLFNPLFQYQIEEEAVLFGLKIEFWALLFYITYEREKNKTFDYKHTCCTSARLENEICV